MFKRMMHMFMPSRCVKEAKWIRGSLYCPCGDILALRYKNGDTTGVYIYPQFRKYEKEIMDIPVGDGEEVIGAVCFDDFCDFMLDLKMRPMNTRPDDIEMNDELQEDTYIGS